MFFILLSWLTHIAIPRKVTGQLAKLPKPYFTQQLLAIADFKLCMIFKKLTEVTFSNSI